MFSFLIFLYPLFFLIFHFQVYSLRQHGTYTVPRFTQMDGISSKIPFYVTQQFQSTYPIYSSGYKQVPEKYNFFILFVFLHNWMFLFLLLFPLSLSPSFLLYSSIFLSLFLSLSHTHILTPSLILFLLSLCNSFSLSVSLFLPLTPLSFSFPRPFNLCSESPFPFQGAAGGHGFRTQFGRGGGRHHQGQGPPQQAQQQQQGGILAQIMQFLPIVMLVLMSFSSLGGNQQQQVCTYVLNVIVYFVVLCVVACRL